MNLLSNLFLIISTSSLGLKKYHLFHHCLTLHVLFVQYEGWSLMCNHRMSVMMPPQCLIMVSCW